MPEAIPREIRNYIAADGKVPFEVWMEGLRGQQIYGRILKRLDRLEDGNFGDHASVGENVWELRFFDKGGHRVYYGEDMELDKHLVILLAGGNKDTQAADIERAKVYWRNYNG